MPLASSRFSVSGPSPSVALTGSPRSAADSRARAERNTGFVQRRVQSVSAAQGFRSCCPAELDALQPAAFTLATLSFTTLAAVAQPVRRRA